MRSTKARNYGRLRWNLLLIKSVRPATCSGERERLPCAEDILIKLVVAVWRGVASKFLSLTLKLNTPHNLGDVVNSLLDFISGVNYGIRWAMSFNDPVKWNTTEMWLRRCREASELHRLVPALNLRFKIAVTKYSGIKSMKAFWKHLRIRDELLLSSQWKWITDAAGRSIAYMAAIGAEVMMAKQAILN